MTLATFPTNFPPQNTPIVDQKGTLTTPWMAVLRSVWGRSGGGTGILNQVNIAATDLLVQDWNLVTASPVTLPALTGGQLIVVQNASGGALTIDAPAGATIDGGANYSLANTKMQIFWFFSATQIFSTQLG